MRMILRDFVIFFAYFVNLGQKDFKNRQVGLYYCGESATGCISCKVAS